MNYVNPPFNYTGSKFKLLWQILPRFDYTKPDFIDLFAGGGSVYANVVDRYSTLVVNDVIAELIECHESLAAFGQAFVERVKFRCPDKDDQPGYVALRTEFNKSREAAQLFALILSCTNNMMRFNQSFEFNQTWGKRGFSDATQEKMTAFINHVRQHAGKIIFTSKSFEEIQPRDWRRVMVYADPPYEGTEAGYNAYWSGSLESRLYEYLKKVHAAGGSFALSGVRGSHKGEPESPVITRLTADGFRVIDLHHDYGKVSRNKTAKRGQEVLICNYSVASPLDFV